MASRFTQYGSALGADMALREIVASRIAAEMETQKQKQHAFENSMRERQIRVSEDTARFNRETLGDQRDALAEQRRQNAAHTMSGDLAIGDALDPQQVATLRAGNMGSNVGHEMGTLASTAMAGYGTEPGARTPSGFLRTRSQPATPERDIWRGTAAQRRTHQQQQELQQLVQSLPTNSPERRAVEYQLLTGNNPPAGFLPREPTDRYSAHPMFDESGQQIGVGAFNAATGEFKPVKTDGYLRAPGGGGGSSSRQLPDRVETFLIQLRGKHPRFEDAMAELTSVLANASGETFSRVAAASALQQLYRQPTGSDALAGMDVGSILGGRPGGSAAAPSPSTSTPAPMGGGTITLTELRAVAQQLGLSDQEAEQQARARGLQVR